MLISWIPALPATLAALAVFLLPGALVSRLLGARGLTWASVSGPVSVSLIGIAAILGGFLRIPWNVWTLIGTTVIVGALAVLVRRGLIRVGWMSGPDAEHAGSWRSPSNVKGFLVGFFAVVLSGAFIVRRIMQIIGVPENFSQRYDNVFHMNAIRFILDTGKGSSLTLASMDPSNTTGFYPGAWHDTVALVAQLSSADIPLAINGTTIALLAVVWPLACFLLVRTVVPSTSGAALTTAVLCGAFGLLPFHLLDWGTLYPNLLSLLLLPVGIALLLGVTKAPFGHWTQRVAPLLLFLAVLPGMALAHPSAILTLLLLAAVLFVVAWWREIRRYFSTRDRRRALWVSLAFALYLAAFTVAWMKLRPSKFGAHWPPVTSSGRALGESLTFSTNGFAEAWILTILVVAGGVMLLRQHRATYLVAWFAMSCFLYISASGLPDSAWRDFWSQIWYHDAHRLAALTVVFALPLGAVTLWELWKLLAQQIGRLGKVIDARVLTAGTAVLAILLTSVAGLALQSSRFNPNLNGVVLRSKWAFDPNFPGNLLSPDEEKLLERLDSKVPEGSVLIGHPASGAALAYAYTGRAVILPALGSSPSADDIQLTSKLTGLDTDPAVCSSVKRLNAYYILDFGTELSPNTVKYTFPTPEEIAKLHKVQLLDQQGKAKLYKITGCK
ncbi:DUF6541 family protein [Arthrobacter sp.]|uniref:DUF6541 family protein n=1 Tax=Arthrobacter sp. TaxID=1667 RepID=UPI00258EE5BC|nr:DUF6541 family protein [Arthrobacter sp.]